MSQRLQAVFDRVKQTKIPAFITYITAGFPTMQDTMPILFAMQEGGADVIEVGIPHSDPIGDGATIQHSSTVALATGIKTKKCIELVKEARDKGLTVPVIFMGYYNPIRAYGEEKIIKDVKDAGGDGFIVVDCPPESLKFFISSCAANSLSYVPLISPTTPTSRLSFISSYASTFIYCVSVMGVTGARDRGAVNVDLPEFIERVRSNVTKPIALGFGVSTRQMKDEYATYGEGVVVGSLFIKTAEKAEKGKAAEEIKAKVLEFTKDAKPAELKFPLKESLMKELNPSAAGVVPATFGDFGGRYVPETLYSALEELENCYAKYKDDPAFIAEVRSFDNYVGRKTPIYYAKRLSETIGGAQIWLKREDLSHTGAHKINNAIGQALLALKMGKKRIIAETGAGQHGVATATICAKLGLQCAVYMGAIDIERQSLNVFKMKMLGATVIPVTSGTKTLKDAINEAIRDWVSNVTTTYYLVGSAIGPHPYPTIVRDFQSVIGRETREQSLSQIGRLPDVVMACVGGGSNAIGMFHPFIGDKQVKIIGVEGGGLGDKKEEHCATIVKGSVGVFHGTKTLLLQDEEGQISGTHSISAGLDYPGVGPEHAWLHSTGRASYVAVNDSQAMHGFRQLTLQEGIIPALESSHAVFYAMDLAAKMPKDQIIMVCLSGRGDKDMGTVAKVEGVTLT